MKYLFIFFISTSLHSFAKMTRQQIIIELANNKKLKEVAANMAGDKEMADEIYQELFIRIYNYDEEKLRLAHEKKYINYLCINIMSKLKHEYNRAFNSSLEIEDSPVDPYEQMEAENERQQYEELLQPIDSYLSQEITQENFYPLTLVKDWMNGESYRTISKRTKIPFKSIGVTVRKEIDKLRNECL